MNTNSGIEFYQNNLTIGGVQVTHTGLIGKTDYGEDTEH